MPSGNLEPAWLRVRGAGERDKDQIGFSAAVATPRLPINHGVIVSPIQADLMIRKLIW